MKKLLLVVGVAGLFAMTSCSKTNSCDCGSGAVVEYEDLNKTQRDVLEASCELAGCTWK